MLSVASSSSVRTNVARTGVRLFSSAPRLVVSRRAWKPHRQPKPKRTVKPDDKPWPRSFQIAGAVAAGTLIPYATIWLASTEPKWRESSMFAWILEQPVVRRHFGEPEWNGVSYTDEMGRRTYEAFVYNHGLGGAQESGEEVPYQYPSELTFQQRQQEKIVEQFLSSEIPVRLVLSDGSGERAQPVRKLPGSIPANAESILKSFELSSRDLDGDASKLDIGVEFLDDEVDGDAHANGGGIDVNPMIDNTSFSTEDNRSDSSATESIRSLLHDTVTYSSWYFHSFGASAADSSSKMSKSELEQSRLEYVIEKLQRDLKDPNCTRDMDDMSQELASAKKDLRRLRWKRLFFKSDDARK